MNIQGATKPLNTKLTGDDRAGLHRSKPANTSFKTVAKQINTVLSSMKQPNRTHVGARDLLGSEPKQSPLSQHERLVKQTQKWVGQTFYGTLMKQMHESPFKSELFDGGRGGQAFGSLYDQQLVERMSRGAGQNLVNAIVHRIEARAQAVRDQVAQARRAA